MKTPSPQEAAKTDWAQEAESLVRSILNPYGEEMRSRERTLEVVALTLKNIHDAALLEADKNGYERGRKEMADALKTIDHRPLTETEIIHGLKIQIERDEALLRECLKFLSEEAMCACGGETSDVCRLSLLTKKIKTQLIPSVSVSEGK